MSGVAGADRIKSRQDFQQFIASYKQLISKFPGFVSIQPSGSYNSDANKNDFGDIDLITHIKSTKNKKEVKLELVHFFEKQPDTQIVAFTSDKHAGKRSYNSGEIVTVRYHDDQLGYSAQIDNIIALDHIEAGFKQQFLDMPAEKQGLVLGLVKIATVETDPKQLFAKLNIHVPLKLDPNQEFEFNLSSTELQLRKVTYKPGTFEQVNREILWRSQNYGDLQKLLYQYDLTQGFDQLLAAAQSTIKNPRSKNRMQGVFGSMITVKSGEVGTAKGANKVAALDKIKNTFNESVFNALVESNGGTMVFAFGRFNPPTIGHELLVNTVKKVAASHKAAYAIFVSRTQDKKKNPLPLDSKLHYLKQMFPGTHFVGANDEVRTFMEAAISFNGKFKNLIMVAGGDRIKVFEDTLLKYNHIEYNFDSIQVVSAGARDPDADDASGASGTKMREYAINNDLKSFISQLPATIDEHTAQQMMNEIRTAMGVKQEQPMSESRLRELIAETKRMSNAVKLQRAWEREQAKSSASRERGNNILNPKKATEKPKAVGAGSGDVKMSESMAGVGMEPHAREQSAMYRGYTGGEQAEGFQDFNKVEPYFVCLAGKPVKHFDYYEDARRFHDNWKKKLYREGDKEKADKITLMPDMRESQSKAVADTAKRLTNPNDGKVAKLRAAGDKRREEHLKSRDIAKKNEAMLPKSAFVGSDKNKLGRAGQLKGSDKRPAKAGDLVGASEAANPAQQAAIAIAKKKKKGVAEGSEREMSPDWHYKNIMQTKGLSDKAKKDTTDIYKKLKKKKEQGVEEEKQRLDPKCWKGYRKAGTKMKGGKRVNNCVPIGETAENILGRLIRILESK